MKYRPFLTVISCCAVLLSACGQLAESSELYEDTDTIANELPADETDDSDKSGLLEEINRHISMEEYGKAVALAEENIDIIEADGAYFSEALDKIQVHYTEVAKLYYMNSAAYITDQNIKGYDFSTGFQGFDAENMTLDPKVLEELMTEAEKVVVNRAVIKCFADDSGFADGFEVSFDVCGIRITYPVSDTILDSSAVTVTEEISEKELLEKLNRHISLEEYGKAVALAEEHIDIIEADRAYFSEALDKIQVHFTEIAKLYYMNSATYITNQNTKGYDYTTGFEGFDAENMTLDPKVLEELMTQAEKVVVNRAVIKCFADESGFADGFEVSFDVCGIRITYPVSDTVLDASAVTETEEISEKELLKRINHHIDMGEYGKAVSLAEGHMDMIEADRKYYSEPLEKMQEHFAQIAKLYYTNASTYVILKNVEGYDYSTGFEGYDAENMTLDPKVLDEFLTEEARAAVNRTTIKCILGTDNYANTFDVSIEFCGMTAVYPSDDIAL